MYLRLLACCLVLPVFGLAFSHEDGEKLLKEVAERIQNEFPNEPGQSLDLETLYAKAAQGMAQSLDPYSDYFQREDVADFESHLDGSYCGIGAYIETIKGRVAIVSAMFGSPAEAVGLKARDIVDSIDGEDVSQLDMNQLIKKIKGPQGSSFKLGIIREGVKKEFEVTRQRIVVPSCASTILPGDIAFLKLSSFDRNLLDSIVKQLDAMQQKTALKGIVVDLRGNGGGLLVQAVDVANLFLPVDKPIVTVKRKNYADVTYTTLDRCYTDLPLVVLVNEASASASEILSGALRDYKRATLIGTKTFGKGCVQQTFGLDSTHGQTELKVTIAKYYLPGGECIHGVGINPDIVVEAAPIRPELEAANIPLLLAYCDELEKDKALLAKLCENDHGDVNAYPGFVDFHCSLKTALSVDDVRACVRAELRKDFSVSAGEPFIYDLQEDVQLKAAIQVLVK